VDDIDPRDFGRVEEQVRALAVRMDHIEEMLHAIQTELAQARGGWRTLMMVGGAAAAAASGLNWALTHLALR
jgi:hypothetical protein